MYTSPAIEDVKSTRQHHVSDDDGHNSSSVVVSMLTFVNDERSPCKLNMLTVTVSRVFGVDVPVRTWLPYSSRG